MAAKFHDNSPAVRAQMEANVQAALDAMGTACVGYVVQQMQNGYYKPIRRTGDLMRDVHYEVGRSAPDTVDIGNSLKYAPFVHDGTSRMFGRPYLRDGIAGNTSKIQEVAEQYLKKGF